MAGAQISAGAGRLICGRGGGGGREVRREAGEERGGGRVLREKKRPEKKKGGKSEELRGQKSRRKREVFKKGEERAKKRRVSRQSYTAQLPARQHQIIQQNTAVSNKTQLRSLRELLKEHKNEPGRSRRKETKKRAGRVMTDRTLPVSPVAIGRSQNHCSAATQCSDTDILQLQIHRFHFFIGLGPTVRFEVCRHKKTKKKQKNGKGRERKESSS